jgi:hypothetical protein
MKVQETWHPNMNIVSGIEFWNRKKAIVENSEIKEQSGIELIVNSDAGSLAWQMCHNKEDGNRGK